MMHYFNGPEFYNNFQKIAKQAVWEGLGTLILVTVKIGISLTEKRRINLSK